MARCHLYEYMEMANGADIYCDTGLFKQIHSKVLHLDSLLLKWKKGVPPPFEIGTCLGQMAREYKGYTIDGFVCGGPKNYLLRMRCNETGALKCVSKIRGMPPFMQTVSFLF